ncbi:uncharacterized protein LOC113776327 [Coffea eugenioides]|uniref:uncharacterized protein LOC113776327 n=1 Tax=Coffea eugenioides TaxID=49369 RepID=UPI000F60FAED|nr:uncharacterized protein LOC113776327 [Coffea eugenioides]
MAATVGPPVKEKGIAPLGVVSSFRGDPALRLSRHDIDCLAAPFHNALVGRFSTGRAPMEVIRKFVMTLGLNGSCSVGLLDEKHVLIRPMVEDDYTRLFARRVWFIHYSPMSILKWSMDFRADHEVAIAPIWVSFPGLPIPFFQRRQLMQLASILGRPLKMDAATSDLRHPSVARVLVEVDVALPLVKRVWIGDEDYGFWQPVDFEDIPPYCSFCPKFGHQQEKCYRRDPSLRPVKVGQASQKSR